MCHFRVCVCLPRVINGTHSIAFNNKCNSSLFAQGNGDPNSYTHSKEFKAIERPMVLSNGTCADIIKKMINSKDMHLTNFAQVIKDK